MDFLQDKIKKKQFLCNYSVFLLNGMLALSIGSLLPFIRDARGLDYAFCGLIVSLHSVGNLFSSFTAGLLPVAIGRKKSILCFNVFCTFVCADHFRKSQLVHCNGIFPDRCCERSNE
mgnify:FL=1